MMNKSIKDDNHQSSENSDQLSRTGADLKKALEAWDELSANLEEGSLSADEQMLQDMQKLLKQLQSKIEEFNR